ncbi:MAG: hypothetical protein R3286_07630 [Gammaproteobacteria bacterium]|nr:hypothetical protein [Gammaproteobacteria bacterium]
MTDPLFSASWYRVAALRPRLRAHAQVHRHEYRGQIWYVLEDHASGRSHRFTPGAHYVIGLMDGRRPVQALWEAASEQLGDDAPTQDEIIQLLGQLHASDVLQCDVSPDTLELLQRYDRHERGRWKRRFWSPLAIRVPLLDPERLLSRLLPLARPLLGWFGFLVWLGVVATGTVLAGLHWPDITEDVVDRALAPHNLLWLWLVYPLVKALHELGHGLATKHWGGEVHEMGIMFLVFMPVPYVDASAASAFREKRRRMIVGGAGIMVELFLAAVALMVWLNVEPGTVRIIAYNVMLIGGVSTLLFNGNPLLRFDGYYVLADAVEIPNLGPRSNQYIGYLIKRYLLGAAKARSPVSARGERRWFVGYGIASFVYRMFIMFAIVMFVAQKFFVIGVLLAIWAIVTQLVVPSALALGKAFTDPVLARSRARVVVMLSLVAALLGGSLFAVPAPLWARVDGIIWVPEDSQVRAGADGFARALLVPHRSIVRRGDPILATEDPFLDARVRMLEARSRELEARLTAELINDRVNAAITRDELAAVSADLDRARERVADLVVLSPADGVLVVPDARDLPGRFLRQGEVFAFVTDDDNPTVRVCVTQDDIGLVRERLRNVSAMVADWAAEPIPALIERVVPAGTQRLPSRALGTAGGGSVPVDPRDQDGLRTLERVFEIDIALLETPPASHIGRRVHVRFDLGAEPLGIQWYRSLRQLFLERFSV